jgi:ERCC4-type nuclease
MYNSEIHVDDREAAIIPFMEFNDMKQENVSYVVKRLEIGDYHIFVENILVAVIERKTWTDLHQSMTDGRKENVENLLAAREQSSCIIFYLIEDHETLLRRRLQAHLDHLLLRHNIHIIYTNSKKESAGRLYELARNFSTIKEIPALFNCRAVSKPERTDYDCARKMWLCITGIGPSIVDQCIKKLSISELYSPAAVAARAALEDVTYPAGRKLNVKKLELSLDNEKDHIKILSSITGVSEGMAREIISQISFRKICETQSLGDVKRSNGKTINKIKEKIIHFINYKMPAAGA